MNALFVSGDSGSKLLPDYRTILSLQKSTEVKAVLDGTSGYDSQEADVGVSGFVQNKSIVYRLKWRTGNQDFCSFINLLKVMQ